MVREIQATTGNRRPAGQPPAGRATTGNRRPATGNRRPAGLSISLPTQDVPDFSICIECRPGKLGEGLVSKQDDEPHQAAESDQAAAHSSTGSSNPSAVASVPPESEDSAEATEPCPAAKGAQKARALSKRPRLGGCRSQTGDGSAPTLLPALQDADVRPADADVGPADGAVSPAVARPADGDVIPATEILHDPKLIKRTKPPEHYIMAKCGGDSEPRRVTGCTQSMSKNYIAIVAAIYEKIRDTPCTKEDACKLRSAMLEGFGR